MRGEDSRPKFEKQFSGEKLLPFAKSPPRFPVIFFFAVALIVGGLLSGRLLISSGLKSDVHPPQPRRHVEQLNGTTFNSTKTKQDPDGPPHATCPEYFRWIYEDLRPWAGTRITKGMLEAAQKKAHFRLVIVKGKAYVEVYEKAYQSRDNLTLWGVLQLLRRYPGKLPDLDLMFNCDDRPEIYRKDYSGPQAPAPPPLFRYSGDDATLDIAFPDWSYWGWPEIRIKPWEEMLKDIKEGNKEMEWVKREPYAYWKGNPSVSHKRTDLLKCNLTRKQDWNARLYRQDWIEEWKGGFKGSNLADQCVYRYKIYIEGKAWSASEKYIMACDSVTLIVRPHYYDFFSRSLIPMQHYWPISPNRNSICSSIKFAVDWGNSHHQKAMAIGEAASKFIQEELNMDYVYDYMFHLLNEYSKLLTFKPTVPSNATELSLESMASAVRRSVRKWMMKSFVKSPAVSDPCAMKPPYDPQSMELWLTTKENSIKQVEEWEESSWENNGDPTLNPMS
ncbi:protein O-glucosyltransferase 1-like [Momordica charantia]|uniref:Protein O-glucosyltransferase 1-like n=1 Tax=Momordica charantia TaxID=3673 RepID=A0A6J1CJQ1_MOMCH|nr:protein O-glucosyltransferase 1-like [Momordica charantia]